jgi:hypothetical protein
MGEVKMETKLIDQIFDKLDEWRHLPAYQLERRADIFFALYLQDVLKICCKASSSIVVIPEFPVRIGTITKDSKSNQSFKIDYVAVDKVMSKIYLIELKTDNKSIRREQIEYLESARDQGISILMQGIRQISDASKEDGKYGHLHSLLHEAELSTSENVPLMKTYSMEILFILPTNEELRSDVIDFKSYAKVVRENGDVLSQRFAQSLDLWANEEAGTK